MIPEEKANELLKKLNKEVLVAQKRRDLALVAAKTSENRTRTAIRNAEAEGKRRADTMIANAKIRTKTLDEEINQMSVVLTNLREQVEALTEQRVELEKHVEALTLNKTGFDNQTQIQNDTLAGLEEQIVAKATEVLGYRGQIDNLLESIEKLKTEKQDAAGFIETLQEQAELLEQEIADLEITQQARRDALEEQTRQLQDRLDVVNTSLLEAERKDKAIRAAWADGHLKLEKRTQVVQKMEARMSDAEARIQELDNYMKF